MAPDATPAAAPGAGDWRIRPAVPADAEALTWLHLDVWDDAYTGLMAPEVLRARRVGVPERVEERRRALERSVDDQGRPRSPTLLAEVEADGPSLVGPALVGFAVAGPARDVAAPAPTELMALYVRAAWWGTGIGHALLRAALGDAPAYLWVLGGNERALRFYRRQGFALDGTEEATEHGPHLRMVRE